LVFLGQPAPALAQDQHLATTSANATPTKLAGRVINAATELPVPRALVRFNDRAMLTDHEGKFLFDQVTDANVNFQVTKPGYSMSSDPNDSPNTFFRLDQITAPVELRLYPDGLITGTVTAPDGELLARVAVQARRSTFDDPGRRWTTVAQTQTDLHGEFRLPVSAGDYRIETRYLTRNESDREAIMPVSLPAPAAGGGPQTIHLHSGEEQHFELRPAVRRTYPVPLSIENAAERGFPSITARANDGTSFNVQVVPSRTPGRANLFLPTGSYRLAARMQTPEAMEVAETSVTVTGSEAVLADASGGTVLRFVPIPLIPVELVIDPSATSDNGNQQGGRPGPSLQFKQSSQNQPNPMQFGLTLQSDNQNPDEDEASASINLTTPRNGNSNGTPGFTAPPGSYRLVARGSGPWFIKSASSGTSDLLTQSFVVAAGSGSGTIRLIVGNQAGTLHGTVTLKGQPSAQSWIYLIPNFPSATPFYSQRGNNDGSFYASYLPPGTYQAIAFEHRHSADYTDPAVLAPFSTFARSVTITAGVSPSLNLNAVPQAELQP
jgi:hypothetical protein